MALLRDFDFEVRGGDIWTRRIGPQPARPFGMQCRNLRDAAERLIPIIHDDEYHNRLTAILAEEITLGVSKTGNTVLAKPMANGRLYVWSEMTVCGKVYKNTLGTFADREHALNHPNVRAQIGRNVLTGAAK